MVKWIKKLVLNTCILTTLLMSTAPKMRSSYEKGGESFAL